MTAFPEKVSGAVAPKKLTLALCGVLADGPVPVSLQCLTVK
jgi:hypothetical protein